MSTLAERFKRLSAKYEITLRKDGNRLFYKNDYFELCYVATDVITYISAADAKAWDDV